MHSAQSNADSARYAQCVRNSKRVRWDIDRDVFRGRSFDFAHHFLPEGLSRLQGLPFLEPTDARLLSQIQGRTYANVFALVERMINAKVLELSQDHWFGDQVALEALVRFSDEELKHQEMFRRIEQMIAAGMPTGYRFLPRPDDVARAVLSKSTWSVLALTCHIELFTQAHYRESIAPAAELSPLYKDVFLFHWREESQHAILDELEWVRADLSLSAAERDAAVDDFIALVGAVDQLLQLQAPADVAYFRDHTAGRYSDARAASIQAAVLGAYRWQYIVSGARHPRFVQLLAQLTTEQQRARVADALSPLLAATEREAPALIAERDKGNIPMQTNTIARANDLPWQPSPSPSVWRKRLFHEGPPEAGTVTSLVRFDPGSTFPRHGHPEGEEVLVLEGVYSDERGAFRAGTYLASPEGFEHAPFSAEGCLLFVRLRQYAGLDREQVVVDTNSASWFTHARGVRTQPLYQSARYPDFKWLMQLERGTAVLPDAVPGAAEIFVLEGGLEDERAEYPRHTWLRLAPGGTRTLHTRSGCVLYLSRPPSIHPPRTLQRLGSAHAQSAARG